MLHSSRRAARALAHAPRPCSRSWRCPAATAQAWPGLNGYIAYGSNRTGSQFSDDIYVSPLDVETPIQLTFRRADDGQPAWSPDGAAAGLQDRAVRQQPARRHQRRRQRRDAADPHVPLQRGPARLVARRRRSCSTGARRRTRSCRTPTPGCSTSRRAPQDPTQPVTQPVLLRTGDERYPSYSPDGTQIAFRGDLDLVEPSGDEEIYVMNADGTNVRQLTSNADFDSAPSWSPDGKQIVFERAPAGTFTPGTEAQEKDIYVMRADGTPRAPADRLARPRRGARVLARRHEDRLLERIATASRRSTSWTPTASNPRRLTDNPARDESPDWQALPFDGRGHQACGDDSLASGGASSVLAMRVPCHVARRIARRWSEAADAGAPRAKAPRPDVHHDAAALRPHRRAVQRHAQGAVRARRRVRVARPGAGARAGGGRPQALAAPEADVAARRTTRPTRAPPRRTRRSARHRRRRQARRGHRGRAAPHRRVSSAGRLVERVLVLGEVVLGERRRSPVPIFFLVGLPSARRGLLHALRRRCRPASGRSAPARCPSLGPATCFGPGVEADDLHLAQLARLARGRSRRPRPRTGWWRRCP